MSNTMGEQVIYPRPIDNLLYKEFNKDRRLNTFFQSNKVGKCVKLFDDYYQSVDGDIRQKGWRDYYLNNVDRQALLNATDFIIEKYKIPTETAAEYVFHRVVGQTWNGMVYEMRCIDTLKGFFPNLIFKKAPYELDENYCVDWQAFDKKLLFGIQIKPESYRYMRSPYQMKAKERHQEQIEKYKKEFDVPHFFVYYADGKMIQDQDLFNKINTYLALSINVRL